MKVAYIPLPDGTKLISYHRHDYKSAEIDGKLYMIDGGQDDYHRWSGDLKKADCYKLIETIREQYEVGKSVSIKNLSTYVLNIYMTRARRYIKNVPKTDTSMKFHMAILNAELKFRKNNGII